MLEALSKWRENSETAYGRLPLPPVCYSSDEIYKLELERIFKKEWICTAHVSELKEVGDYLTFDLVGHPVLIIHDGEGEVHAYSNVCPHRAARLASGSGNKKSITCPYHAWTFELDGKLRGAPRMEPGQLENICLNPLNLEIWQGLVFVNLDLEAMPLAPRLESLASHIGRFNLAEHSTTFTTDGELDCNWKVFVENFCESYHVFKVHKNTLEPDTPTSTVEVLPGGAGYNHHTMTVITSDEPLDNKDNLCCIYPCMVVSIGKNGCLWLSIRPTSRNRLQYRAWIAGKLNGHPGEEESIGQEIAHVLAFMAEDNVIMEGIQIGLDAGLGNLGPLNEMEKTNWQFGQYYAGKLLD